MLEISLIDILGRAVYSLLTLYMMVVLLRWIAPWLHLDLKDPRLRWVTRLTEPLIETMRRGIRSLETKVGPLVTVIDLAPLAAFLSVVIVRAIAVEFLARLAFRG